MTANDIAYSAVRALLCDSISGASLPGAASRDRLEASRGDAPFWRALVNEAEYHGVVAFIAPLVAAYARTDAGLVPQDTLRALGVLTLRQKKASAARERVVDRVLSAYAETGIDVLLLKGSALAHLIYPQPEFRPMVDIDMMVPMAELEAAAAILRKLGFAFSTGPGPRSIGRWHHLPPAEITEAGFAISLELHTRALSPDYRREITFERRAAPLQGVPRRDGQAACTLGHIDMLRHICHHAFGPTARVRLKHLLDLKLYRTVFGDVIDWQAMRRDAPDVLAILDVAELAFATPLGDEGHDIGAGMLPLSEILGSSMRWDRKLDAIFNPPDWWLRGHYGIPPDGSLAACKTIRHPANMIGSIGRRLIRMPGSRLDAA